VECTEASDRVEFSVNDHVAFRKTDRESGVYNKTEGVITSLDDRFITIRTEDGRDLNIDTQDKRWEHEETGRLGLAHSYSTTVFSSQGVSPDRVYVLDSLSLSRASAGVALSRHKEKANLYIDKELRYEAKIKDLPQDEWHPVSEFKDEDCLARVGTAYSKLRTKNSTLDFDNWKENGSEVNTKHIVAAANISQDLTVAKEQLEKIRESSKHPELRAVHPTAPLPFEKLPSFNLPEPKASSSEIRQGVEALTEVGISDQILSEASKQGFLRFDKANPVFCGRRDDGALVNTSKGRRTENEPTRRDTFPPILYGSTTQTDIVSSGNDALALRALQIAHRVEQSTIIVKTNGQSLTSLHTRSLIERAKTVNFGNAKALQALTPQIKLPVRPAVDIKSHETKNNDKEGSIVEANANARAAAVAAAEAAAAARRAVAELAAQAAKGMSR